MITKTVEETFEQILSNTQVKEGLEFIKLDNEKTVAEQMELTAIPAPTFQEEARGEVYKTRLIELGLKEVSVDSTGNVFGVREGSGNGPKLVVSAHLDTVFPEGTDVEPKLKDGKIYAPGIADDGRGLAVVLSMVRALDKANIQTDADIIFCATVGEEGLGDLRGVKALFHNRDDIDGFISIEPGDPERTTYLATGSHRYNVTYYGPGGHSFGDFGKPSAIHAMGRAIAKISELQVPQDPKTTFTVGTINGGTSVNTIAQNASMLVDIRSTSQEELLKVEEQILAAIKLAAEEENKRWETDSIKVEIELVGDRPPGSQSSDAVIVQTALAATKALGFQQILDSPSSTDSNVPISLGIPAVTLGGGGKFGGVHTLNEFFDPKDAYFGAQKIFLTILGLAGIQEVSEPLLQKR
ncbi:peptidase M20 [Heyndrickxia shackletonii]|uniref:Peptidase M20 n=1 Tax=Heyndrickxia shackletonii TaxID=157838 RepID=A0A0Q3TK24_9BACI|nr:M20/M25/M40 family metallo-hydrolase [Heyndrickxia shackletonii]KQL54344.1 peptidase M20 [Heyndrickxia shackletonii]NEZ01432.1 M20/M25/M40 family metallo-hydrolase [Heyndrickxia shackletonii]